MELAQDAPTGAPEGTGGQGGEGEGTLYAGYDTPEALAEAHTSLTSEKAALEQQVQNLESLKGRHGNEIGQLRSQIANLTGQIEGMKSAAPQAPAGPTIEDIAAQVEDGEVSYGEGLKMAMQTATQATQAQMQQMLQDEVGKLQAQNDRQAYVTQFVKDNPGYEEAYNTGKLDPWIQQGLSGEVAWDKFQIQAKDQELADLKAQSEAATKAAEESGINKGVQLEKGKSAAGKVLTGKGSKFAQKGSNYDLSDPNQRRQAGLDRLAQLRGG